MKYGLGSLYITVLYLLANYCLIYASIMGVLSLNATSLILSSLQCSITILLFSYISRSIATEILLRVKYIKTQSTANHIQAILTITWYQHHLCTPASYAYR